MSVSPLSSAPAPKATVPNPLKKRQRPDEDPLPSSACYPSVSQGICRLRGDSFGHCMGFLTTEALSRFCSVSRSWRLFIDGPNGQFLWKNASIREGVPVVEGEKRDYKVEFKFLRPITIGGRTIARYLGKIVGEVPRMRQDRFLELRDSRDFFEPEKFKKETHVVLVDPAALKIIVGPNRPLALDESGTLVEVPMAERAGIAPEELTVPFSFKNLRALANYPLAGMRNCPVFNSSSIDEVFEQCNAPSQNSILIMRIKGVARDTPFNGDQGQKAQLKNLGCEVTTVRQRGFFDAIKILQIGICPDNREGYLYKPIVTTARTADRVFFGATEHTPVIGDFVSGYGLRVFGLRADFDFTGVFANAPFSDRLVVVPVVSAEVLRPSEPVDDLETDEGH